MAHGNDDRGNELRALLLDGDSAALRAVSRSLASRSFSVLTASDGTRGLALLVDELLSLDVVVLAADLPHRDARGFARLVRGAGGEQDLAIVVVTREATRALRRELHALGVDAVVDAEAGSEAVAAAALAAIVARGTRILGEDAPAPASDAEPPTPIAARLVSSFTGSWSLAPAW